MQILVYQEWAISTIIDIRSLVIEFWVDPIP